jgi:hypothetical protein
MVFCIQLIHWGGIRRLYSTLDATISCIAATLLISRVVSITGEGNQSLKKHCSG